MNTFLIIALLLAIVVLPNYLKHRSRKVEVKNPGTGPVDQNHNPPLGEEPTGWQGVKGTGGIKPIKITGEDDAIEVNNWKPLPSDFEKLDAKDKPTKLK